MIINVTIFAILGSIMFLLSVSGTDAYQIPIKASSANLTAYTTPYAYYDYERDPRRWFGMGQYAPGTSFTGPSTQFPVGFETIAIGLMITFGAGFIVVPLMIILYMMFIAPTSSPNLNSGFNFIQHPATTTIGRRKRRDAEEKSKDIPTIGLLDMMSPVAHDELLSMIKKFTDAPDRIEYLKNILLQ